MATDATGTPTALGIPKYNTSADAPSGLGFNAAMDSIDALIAAKQLPAATGSNKVPLWGGASWTATTVPPAALTPGSAAQVLSTNPAGVVAWLAGMQRIDDQKKAVAGNSFQFVSIPANYSHLLIPYSARSATGNVVDSFIGQVNGDSGFDYDQWWMDVSGTSVTAGGNNATQFWTGPVMPGGGAIANRFGSGFFFIPDYTNTTQQKSIFWYGGVYANTGVTQQFLRLGMWHWRSNAAINRIDFTVNGATNFAIDSRMTLYGLG